MAQHCPYYHKNISRQEAEQLLLESEEDGCFLIRDSGSVKGVYILCLLCNGRVFCYRILTDSKQKMYIESSNVSAIRQNNNLTELIEYTISRGQNNGLKAALTRGIRTDGEVSSDSEAEAEYVDVTYTDANLASGHIYAEPDAAAAPPPSSKEEVFKGYFLEKLETLDQAKVSEEFVNKVRKYIKHDIANDGLAVVSEEAKNPANSVPKLKALLNEEGTELRLQLNSYLAKLELLKDLFKSSSSDPKLQQGIVDIDGESSYKTLVGLLSVCKQSLVTIEIKAVEAFNELVGYINVDPLLKKQHLTATIPEVVFEVRQQKALLGGMQMVTLKVAVHTGKLYIIREGTTIIDNSNTFSADKIAQVIKCTNNTKMLELLIFGRKKEIFFFDGIRPREHFCQLLQQMKKIHAPTNTIDSLSVYCGTWNMGNELPPKLGLQPWLKSQGHGKTLSPALASGVAHDIYAIGTQESKISEKDWVVMLKRLLLNQFNIYFELVAVCTLWQIRLVIFVKPEFKNRISLIKQGSVRTGIANALGNKGAVAISFNFDGTSLCFISTHLVSNRERVARRNQNFRDILKSLSGTIGNRNYTDFDVSNQFNHVFWFGDLNYRVDDDIETVLPQAQENHYVTMLKKDQLLDVINTQKAFYGFDEEVITFAPTYRYHVGSKDSFDWKKVKKSGVKINAPSWCDRVLWKSYPNSMITNTSYGCLRDVTTSDHKPVFSSFTLKVLPMTASQTVHSPNLPVSITLQNMACELDLLDKPCEFSVVIMSTCLEGLYESQPSKVVQWNGHTSSMQWDDKIQMIPLISDPTFLMEQHLSLAVKARSDGEVFGDTVVSLLEVFSDPKDHDFECDLIYLGQKTGCLRGVLKADIKGLDIHYAGSQQTSNYIVYSDGYARPLAGLFWEDSESPANIAEQQRNSDSVPRVQGRPKSFVGWQRPNEPDKSALENVKRTPIPSYYNIPKAGGKPASVAESSLELPEYYNFNSEIEAQPDPTQALQPRRGLHVDVAPVSASHDLYKDLQRNDMKPLPKPRIVAKGDDKQPNRNKVAYEFSGDGASMSDRFFLTSWLGSITMMQYVKTFRDNKWTSTEAISRITKVSLSAAGIKQTDVLPIMNAISQLKMKQSHSDIN